MATTITTQRVTRRVTLKRDKITEYIVYKKNQIQQYVSYYSPDSKYLTSKKQEILAYLSFLSIVWFLLAPICIELFVIFYFGILQGMMVVLTCSAYNYIEDKLHPHGLVGRKWKAFHHLMGRCWEPFQRYMPIQVVKIKPEEFQPPRKFLFCFHPHGVVFLGPTTIGNLFDKLFPGLDCYHLMSNICFISPIFRQYTLWNGCIPATKVCAASAVLNHGVSLSVVPGGLAEMLESDPTPRPLQHFEVKRCRLSDPSDDVTQDKKTVVLYLQSRKGFIKLALELGLDLVPVFTFGETDTYRQVRWGMKWRLRISRFITVPVTWIWGKYFLFPFKTPISVVFGEPLVVERDANPSQEAIEKLHTKYIDELCKLFENNKSKYNYHNARLVIM